MVKKDDVFSIRKQCELLSVNRSSLYYQAKEIVFPDEEREEFLMERIDFWNTQMCFLGVKKIHNKLKVDDGIENISVGKIRRLMEEMGIYCVYPHKNTSNPAKNGVKLPYLLKSMNIWLPNMVWSIDITYIKMHRTHMYLTAIIDWFSRFLLAWELSDTLETAPVLHCVEAAVKAHGIPAVLNSDQGSQFTSSDYHDLLCEYHIRQSMDGKGRWQDNRRIERWFRSLKVENIYINEYRSPKELRCGINDYVNMYNYARPHQSLNYQRPATFHHNFFEK